MNKSLSDWRAELCEIDAELILLLQRRTQLAVELLTLLRSEQLTLGEMENDLDRLGIFLYAFIDEPVSGLLDKSALLEIFSRIVQEQKQLMETISKSPS
jgi:hypothetical protein